MDVFLEQCFSNLDSQTWWDPSPCISHEQSDDANLLAQRLYSERHGPRVHYKGISPRVLLNVFLAFYLEDRNTRGRKEQKTQEKGKENRNNGNSAIKN